ncbi:hypothetical protein CRG98_048855, partial [Punica granatum]
DPGMENCRVVAVRGAGAGAGAEAGAGEAMEAQQSRGEQSDD